MRARVLLLLAWLLLPGCGLCDKPQEYLVTLSSTVPQAELFLEDSDRNVLEHGPSLVRLSPDEIKQRLFVHVEAPGYWDPEPLHPVTFRRNESSVTIKVALVWVAGWFWGTVLTTIVAIAIARFLGSRRRGPVRPAP